MTNTTQKSFTREVNGTTLHYHRTEKGYCYLGTTRIKLSEFEEAEITAIKERREHNKKIADKIRRTAEECERMEREEEVMNIIEIDGVRWSKDLEGNTYKDGIACKKSEFNKAIGIKSTISTKKRKTTKKRTKDVAFEYEGTILTAKQMDFLYELSIAGEDILGSRDTGWWTDCICDCIGGQFSAKPMTVGAMISTLCEKNIMNRRKEKRDGYNRKVCVIELTGLGKEIWNAMKLS